MGEISIETGGTSYGRVPVHNLMLDEVVDKRRPVLVVLGDRQAQVEVGVLAEADGEIVARRQDVDTVRKRALPTDVLLERRRGSATAVNLIWQSKPCRLLVATRWLSPRSSAESESRTDGLSLPCARSDSL